MPLFFFVFFCKGKRSRGKGGKGEKVSLFFHVFFPHEIFTSQGRERVKKRNAPVRVVDGPALGPVFDTGHQGPEPSPVERRVGLEQPVLEGGGGRFQRKVGKEN